MKAERRKRSVRALLFLPLILGSRLAAQPASADSLLLAPLHNAPSDASLLDLLLPEGLRAGYLTRAWVRDSLPRAGDSLDDLDRLDMIYLRALGESGGDIGTALFASLVASFEHHGIPLTIGIHLPLTLEPREAFDRRVALLPHRLYADRGSGGDRDKLQHFFGSAWLAYTLDGRELADLVGILVEKGEALFVRGGVDDPRDIRTNRLGQQYAVLLRDHPRLLPSALFRAWNRVYLRKKGE